MKNFLENRYKYAKILATVATVSVGIYGLLTFLNPPDFVLLPFVLVWLVGTIGAYLCGGLVTAIKMALSIGKWGWLVVPFPIDIATGLGSIIMALVAFLFVPIIPVMKAEKEYGVR